MKIFFLSLWMKQIDFLSDTMGYARNKNDFFIDNWNINVYNFSKWLPLHVPINKHYVNKEYVYYVYQKQYDFLDHQCKRKKTQTLILNYCILTLCLSIFCLCTEVIYQTIIWKVNLCWNTYILGFFTCYWRNYCWTSHFYNATLLNLQQSLFPFMFSNVYSKYLNIIYFKRKNEDM